MIKTVYFDLGNVLIFFSMPKMFAQLADCTGLSVERVQKLLIETGLREQYEKGWISTKQLHQEFQARAVKTFSIEDLKIALSNIFTPNKKLWPIVEQLKKSGIRLILLSNTCECHFEYAEANYPILQLFDRKILSYEVGAWKPELKIFQTALQYAQCSPEECFYTDDIPQFIQSARKAGLNGEVYTGVARLKKKLREFGCL